MKAARYIVLSILILGLQNLYSQTISKNYIQTYSVQQKAVQNEQNINTDNALESITYIDGLGRSIQTVGVGISPDGGDVVQGVVYDEFGRQTRDYLPYVRSSSSNGFASSWETDQYSFYSSAPSDRASTSDPWMDKEWDNSPLNRVMEQGYPGSTWQILRDANGASTRLGHTVRLDYQTNISAEVQLWTWDKSTKVASSTAAYLAGTLYKTETQDENGNITSEYQDKQGRVILKSSELDNQTLCTYYVYDDFNNLVCVIPPESFTYLASIGDADTDELPVDLVYTYVYDSRQRMVEKKIPGQEAIYMVYDKQDKLVLTQDGNQRQDDQWMFTKYDVLGRPVMTGIYEHYATSTQAQMQTIVDGFVNNTTTFYYEAYNESTNTYSNQAFPTASIIENLSYMYYDDYDFVDNESALIYQTPSEAVFMDNEKIDNPRGLLTGTKVKVLGASTSYVWSASYYDKYDRVIQTKAQYYEMGLDIQNIAYDFTGKVIHSKLEHQNPGDIYAMYWYNDYDKAGRLENVYHRINNQDTVLVANYEYNELGELIEKGLNANNPNDLNQGYWQSVDYRYNIRGWLTSVNNSTLTVNSTNNPTDTYDDLFGMELMYESGFSSGAISSGTQYNGNISGMKWKVDGGSERGYGFSYDDLNRLGKADYAEKNESAQMFINNIDYYTVTGEDDDPIEYDKNGNIRALWRKGAMDATGTSFDFIDRLEYTYDGNRLKAVNDISNVWKGNDFKDGVEATTEYTYDANGNMETDANKGIVNIVYNTLNLPEEIDFGLGDKILYFYTADGIKQKKEVYESSVKTSEMSYKGSFVYEGTGLAYVLFDEGRLMQDAPTDPYVYEYFLKDHLGNTRVSFTKDGTIVEKLQEDHYYPFGMTFQGVNSSILSPENKYKYNGKELQDDDVNGNKLNMYDYGARFYDAALARWHSIDPLAENHFDFTPYNYTLNNPILYIDPMGMDTVNVNSDDSVKKDDVVVLDDGSTTTASTDDVVVTPNDDPDTPTEEDDSEAEERESPARSVIQAGGMIVVGLVADDVSGVGIADDVLIPPVVAITAVVAIIAHVGYEIYQFAQHGKNRGTLGAGELEALEAKRVAGTLTAKDKQKLKRHEKNKGKRRSRQNKDK